MNDLTTTLKPSYVPSILAVQDSYTPHVKAFTDWLAGRPLTMEMVHDYVRELNGSRYAAATIRVKRQAVKRRVRQAFAGADLDTKAKLDAALHDLDREPETRAPKVASYAVGSEKVVTEPEYRRMLAWTRSERLRLLIETLWLTGCRVSEILDLRPADVKEEGMLADLRVVGKGRKERHVRIPAALLDRVRETFAGTEYLFQTETGGRYSRSYVSNAVKRIARGALERDLSAHCLRHSFATRMIARTRKLQAVSQYLGHSTTAITLNMYVHESLEATELFTDTEPFAKRTARGVA